MNWYIYTKWLRIFIDRISFFTDKLFEKSKHHYKDLSSINILQNNLFMQSKEPYTMFYIASINHYNNLKHNKHNLSRYHILFKELKYQYNNYKKIKRMILFIFFHMLEFHHLHIIVI